MTVLLHRLLDGQGKPIVGQEATVTPYDPAARPDRGVYQRTKYAVSVSDSDGWLRWALPPAASGQGQPQYVVTGIGADPVLVAVPTTVSTATVTETRIGVLPGNLPSRPAGTEADLVTETELAQRLAGVGPSAITPQAVAAVLPARLSDAELRKTSLDAVRNSTVIPDALAQNSTVAGAAAAAVTANIAGRNLVEATDPRLPAAGDPTLWRVRDNDGAVALSVDAAGDTHVNAALAGDGYTIKTGDPRFLRLVDTAGYVSAETDATGKWRIYDADFATGASPVSRVVLLIGLGQSNMEGREKPYNPRLDPPDPRLLMWNWSTQALATATVPLSSQQSQTGLSPLTTIGREFVARVGPSTQVVLLNAAAGGSGLVNTSVTQGTWDVDYTGPNPMLYNIAVAEIDKTISAIRSKYGVNPEVWLYWHQGEADGATYNGYIDSLDQLVNALRTHLGDQTIPFTMGGIVPEYLTPTTAAGPRRALIEAQARLEYTGYADGIPNAGDADQAQGGMGLVHYNREGGVRLAKAMYEASLRATYNKIGSPPHRPLDVSATFVAGTLTVKWSAPYCRVTNYVLEYAVDGGSWITAPDRTPLIDLQATVTGITGTVVQVRVSTVSDANTSTPTTPVTALGV